MKNTWIVDIEVYPNCYFCGVKDYKNNKIYTFEISEWKDERKEFYNVFSKYDGYLVSFNGVHYDNVVNSFLLKEWDKLKNLPVKELNQKLKWFSDKVIQDDFETIKWYKWYKTKWIDVDLYLYWSKMLRQSKQLSLKALAVQLNWDEIQELPYSPETFLTKEQFEEVKRYNLRNDLGITEMLFKKMKEDIELRHYIQKEYGLECWSMDAPKIASEYLLEYYCQKIYTSENGDYESFKKQIRTNKYIPQIWTIKDYLPEVNFKTSFFKQIYEKVRNTKSNETFLEKIPFFQENHAVMLSVSQGGIHSENNNQIYEENDNYYLIDADVAGLYPTLFRKYKFLRKELHIVLDKYVEMIDDRTTAKRNGEKKKDNFLKLCNNAFSGLVDSEVTWMYSPEHILALRVFGQMIQLRFMEELNEVGIDILFTNTDGTLVRCPKNKIQQYHEIALSISKEFQIEWEFCLLKNIYFSNTNNYISVIYKEYMMDDNLKEINVKTKGKTKRKGAYFKLTRDEEGKSEIPLGDSVNENIICRALTAYFVNGVDIAEYMTNPEKYGNHIYDYCLSKKINKGYTVWHNQIQVQNLNRYYFSKNAPYLYKQKKGKTTFEHVNKDSGVILFNKFEDKPWDEYKINYPYYISKTRKIIDELQEKQRQGILF